MSEHGTGVGPGTNTASSVQGDLAAVTHSRCKLLETSHVICIPLAGDVNTSSLAPGAGERRLSDEILQQWLILSRAGSSAVEMAGYIKVLPNAAMLETLQTRAERVESVLAQEPLCEEDLWGPISDLVESLTIALNTCSKECHSTLLRDLILDGPPYEDDDSIKGPKKRA